MDEMNKFFEEKEKELNTNESTEDIDDVWNSDKDPEELLNELTQEPVIEEGKKNVEVEQTEVRNENYKLIITRPLKYNGEEIYVKSEDELLELAQKGMDYSSKMSKIEQYQNIISLIENGSVSKEHIETFINALSGNSDAKKTILNILGVSNDIVGSPYDEETDKKQDDNVQKQKHFSEIILEDIYKKDPELYGKIAKIFRDIDDGFKKELLSSEDVFKSFIGSVVQGEFERVYPYAVKEKALNPHLTWVQAYIKGYEIMQKGGYSDKVPEEPIQADVKQTKQEPTSSSNEYDEIWNSDYSAEELENLLVQEI